MLKLWERYIKFNKIEVLIF